jgi:hypothetical protein
VQDVFPATVREIDNLLKSSTFNRGNPESIADCMMTSVGLSEDGAEDGDVMMSTSDTSCLPQQEHASDNGKLQSQRLPHDFTTAEVR